MTNDDTGRRGPPQCLSIRDVAEATSLSTRTTERRVKSGELPAHKAGSRVLISTADLEKWLEGLPGASDS